MEKAFINPPGLYRHPSYTRLITVKGPCKFIYISGQTPSDEAYQPVAKGDYKGQYEHIMAALTVSTMIGVTRLSHPDFLIEVEIVAVTAN